MTQTQTQTQTQTNLTLRQAIAAHDLDGVRRALSTGGAPRFPTRWPKEYDAYSHAIALGYSDVFDLLVTTKKPEPALPEKYTRQVLQHQRFDMLRTLMTHGVDLNQMLAYPIRVKDGSLNTEWLTVALEQDAEDREKHKAARPDDPLLAPPAARRVETLLALGCHPDGPKRVGRALQRAILLDDPHPVRRLLKAGADVENRMADGDGETPLLYACRAFNHGKIILALLQAGANPNVHFENGEPLLNCLIERDDAAWVGKFLQYGTDPNVTRIAPKTDRSSALSFALRRKNADVMKVLLKHGADPNQIDIEGLTPMNDAALWANNYLLVTLVEYGGDLYRQTQGHRTVFDRLTQEKQGLYTLAKRLAREGLLEKLGQALLPSLIGKDGKADKELLAYAGLGLLPEIANPANWGEHRYAEGWQTWQQVRAAMPPYWQAKMLEIDTTGLQQCASGKAEPESFQQRLQTQGVAALGRRTR